MNKIKTEAIERILENVEDGVLGERHRLCENDFTKMRDVVQTMRLKETNKNKLIKEINEREQAYHKATAEIGV